jgi:hypothetical protein
MFLSVPYVQAYFCASPTARPFVFPGLQPLLGLLFSTLGISDRYSFPPKLVKSLRFQPGVSLCREIVSLARFVRLKFSSVVLKKS